MLRFFYIFSFLCFFHFNALSQTIDVSGECITGTITLNFVEEIDGKPAYLGTGTVQGIAGAEVSIYWLSPDNLWVLAFDGQPYFQNACNTPDPPGATLASCPWTEVPGFACTGATELSLTGSGILPVRLLSFTAAIKDHAVHLQWTTATETNNKGFEIQRSKDGINWSPVGFVNGAGNANSTINYSFLDNNPLAGKNFYRLLQTDFDGRFSYSKIISITVLNASFYTLKNNTGNGIYEMNIQSNTRVVIAIMDISGKQLMKKNLEIGDHQLNISNYPAGIYLLRLQKGNEIIIEKLVKQ